MNDEMTLSLSLSLFNNLKHLKKKKEFSRRSGVSLTQTLDCFVELSKLRRERGTEN